MIEFPANPVVRRAIRQWPALLVLTAGIAVGFSDRSSEMLTPFGIAGSFCLAYGLPRAALWVIEWDRSGRLDQLRLAGWTPAKLIAALLIGTAAPWLAAGTGLLGYWMLTEEAGRAAMTGILPMSLLAATLAFVALALPRGRAMDPRIATMGLALVSLVFAALSTAPLGELLGRLAQRVGVSEIQLALLGSLAMAVLAGACLPRVIALGSRPARPSPHLSKNLAGTLWLRVSPRLLRGLRQGAVPSLALAITGLAALALLRWLQAPSNLSVILGLAMMISVTPLAVGAAAISVASRGDTDGGRLDILRTAGIPVWASLAETIAGQWAPYLLSWVLLHGVSWALWYEPLQRFEFGLYAYAPALAWLCLAPVPLIEGWNRGWLGSFTLASLAIFSVAFNTGTGVLLVGWIPWVIAAQVLASGAGPVRTRVIGLAAAAALATVMAPPRHAFPSAIGLFELDEAKANLITVFLFLAGCVELRRHGTTSTRILVELSMTVLLVISLVSRFRTGYGLESTLVAGCAVAAIWAGHAIRASVSQSEGMAVAMLGGLAFLIPFLVNTLTPNLLLRSKGRTRLVTFWDVEVMFSQRLVLTIGLLFAAAVAATLLPKVVKTVRHVLAR